MFKEAGPGVGGVCHVPYAPSLLLCMPVCLSGGGRLRETSGNGKKEQKDTKDTQESVTVVALKCLRLVSPIFVCFAVILGIEPRALQHVRQVLCH